MAVTVTPTQVAQYLKGMTEQDPYLSNIAIEGQLTDYRKAASGHHYFSLKDEAGLIGCIMFQWEARGLKMPLSNGMKVVASGAVTIYPRDGKYQLYCKKIQPQGLGDLHLAFEEMKAKLEQEGLFDQSHKKKIPFFPQRVALITSPTGAVVRDMSRILQERCPITKIYVVPVLVQGEGAAGQMAQAVAWANYYNIADVLILGRGGGSTEDLWAFNEEVLARAIFASQIPVVSAVGHEPDVTIADFVADLRAATPTHAAELVVPQLELLKKELQQQEKQISARMLHQVQMRKRYLSYLAQSPGLKDPYHHLRGKAQQLDRIAQRLEGTISQRIQEHRHGINRLAASLHALSPMEVMGRGYAIPRTPAGEVVTSIRQADVGETLTLSLKDGRLACKVEEKLVGETN